MNIENEYTFRQILAQGINLFIGSGFSILAKDKKNRTLPVGSSLASEIISRFKVPHLSHLSLLQICTIIETTNRDELYSYFRNRFSVESFDRRYSVLTRLNIKNIFTTNVDDLIYKIYSHSHKHFLNDIDVQGPAFADRNAINIVTLHGSVIDNNRPMTFGTLDIAASFRTDPDRWHFLTGKIQDLPTLFWGYSMSDAGTLEALSPHSVQGRPHKGKWIVLRPSTEEGTAQYFKALGFQIITADTDEFLDFLKGMRLRRDS